MPRIEIVSDRRRRYDPAFRDRVVRASYESGLSIREISRQYGICISLIYRWRRQISGPTSFIPVGMLPDPAASAIPIGPEMTIALPNGTRIEVPQGADIDRVATLARRLLR